MDTKETPTAPAAPAITEPTQHITYDDFAKITLRVGQIMAAERLEKSEKLLKLSVDVGDSDGPRQILAGIAKHYAPDTLIGRKVAVVVNLAPRPMMGLVSHGMLLAASDDLGQLELVSISPAMKPGSQIR